MPIFDYPGFIYLLLARNGKYKGWYRLGRTRNLRGRFQKYRWMSRANHWNLTPVCVIKVDKQENTERFFHWLFDDKRSRQRHNNRGQWPEWFKLSDNDLDIFLDWAQSFGKVYHLAGSWQVPGLNMPKGWK